MAGGRDKLIAAGFTAFRATGLHRLLARWTRGRGAILAFHHVRPADQRRFTPNRLLEITPEFLDAVLLLLREQGFVVVTMDDALARMARPAIAGEPPFAVLTFDDGYWDNRDFALPVLQKHGTPFTLYATTGFAERSARLWWRELEEAVRVLDRFRIRAGNATIALEAADPAQKQAAFAKAYWCLRGLTEAEMMDEIARLAREAAVDGAGLAAQMCMDWPAIEVMARNPLCTIGVHTLTHPMLAKGDVARAQREMQESRAIIERHIGGPALHLAYPVGDATSAGEREFALARDLGFASAVTMRPGMLLPAHASRLTALPRLSINGNWQQTAMVGVLLTGAPFALINGGRPA